MKKGNIYLVIFILIFSVCKGQNIIVKYINLKNQDMEKIDIKELESLNENLKKSNKTELHIDNISKTVKVTSISDVIYYTEKKDGKTIRISGNSINGFIKSEIDLKSDIEKRSEFYPTGNLKRTGQVKYRNDRTDYAVGLWYSFDENGDIVEKIEYNYDDSLFLFKEEQILRWITVENLDNNGKWKTVIQKWPQVIANDKIKDEAIWLIQIYDEENIGIITIMIDAKTGNKIGEKFDKIVK